MQLYINTVPNVKFLFEKCCRLVYQIVLICRQKRKVGRHRNPARLIAGNLQPVKQMNRLHDHPHLMVPVRSLPYHIKSEIYFCQCFYRNLFHNAPMFF